MKKILTAILLASATLASAGDITLSKGIKKELSSKIIKDLDVLENLKFKSNDEDVSKLMNVSVLTSASAVKWLENRVKYIIEENATSLFKLLIKKSIFIEKEGVTFPNQDILPYSLDPKNFAVSDEEEGVVVMSNIGAGIYLGGKMKNELYGMKISRGLIKKGIKVLVESPRAGIIQIGEGLFAKDLTVNNQNPGSVANSINRLGTFFHEARHSDGNGASLGYTHSKCPAGHDYEGVYACDESLNGPYKVGAVMTMEMLKSCDSCSEREKEILKLNVLDSENRIMKKTHKGTPSVNWDPSPESL